MAVIVPTSRDNNDAHLFLQEALIHTAAGALCSGLVLYPAFAEAAVASVLMYNRQVSAAVPVHAQGSGTGLQSSPINPAHLKPPKMMRSCPRESP